MLPTKLWEGIKICTSLYVRPSIRTYIRTYKTKSCVRNSFYTPWWILFTPIHSDQHDMEMTVKIGFCNIASFTWVMRLGHGASVSYRHISSLLTDLFTHSFIHLCIHSYFRFVFVNYTKSSLYLLFKHYRLHTWRCPMRRRWEDCYPTLFDR